MSALIERALAAVRQRHQLSLFVLAALLGVASGYASLGLRLAVEFLNVLIFGANEEAIVMHVSAMSPLTLIAAPTLGGLVIGLACVYLLPQPQPQGVADVLRAAALGQSRLGWKDGLSAAAVSAASLGCGASVGREGPVVHLGACIASEVGKRLRLDANSGRTLMGASVAAAVAAAFNAPLAGAFFALEVVVGHYGVAALAPIAFASALGTAIVRTHLGDDPVFDYSPQILTSVTELPAFLLLGLVCGIAALLLGSAIAMVERVHDRAAVPRWARPALGGLIFGGVAVWFPEVMGVGYEITDAALEGSYGLSVLIVLAIAKGAATSLCLGSRFGGGVFSPSLAIGALAGGAFGLVAAGVFPDLASDPGAYALAGMAALAGATLGAPISTVIMAFELTRDYGVTMALLPAVAAASLIHRSFGHPSFFHAQLARRGQPLADRRERQILAERRVDELMRSPHILPGHADLETMKAFYQRREAPICVADEEGALCGVVDFDALAAADAESAAREEGAAPVRASDVARMPLGLLTPEDDLAKALRMVEASSLSHYPIVADRDSRRLVGELRALDLVRAYNRALLAARAAERGDE